MSIKNLKFKLDSVDKNIISFTCEDIIARFFVLEEDIFRVLIHNVSGLKVKNTWLVAPGLEDIPFEGIDKFDVTKFTLPKFQVIENENLITIKTNKIAIDINLINFKIIWSYLDNIIKKNL